MLLGKPKSNFCHSPVSNSLNRRLSFWRRHGMSAKSKSACCCAEQKVQSAPARTTSWSALGQLAKDNLVSAPQLLIHCVQRYQNILPQEQPYPHTCYIQGLCPRGERQRERPQLRQQLGHFHIRVPSARAICSFLLEIYLPRHYKWYRSDESHCCWRRCRCAQLATATTPMSFADVIVIRLDWQRVTPTLRWEMWPVMNCIIRRIYSRERSPYIF